MIGLEPAHKKEFQLERIILFSDAVFAIAITLLVLEIKVPEIEGNTDQDLLNTLLHLTPKFVGFFVSFFVIGQNWIVHHKLFGFVKDYNGKLLWLNLFFLLSIVLMPFSTALYSENVRINLSFIIYCINIIATGLFNSFLWNYIGNANNKLSDLSEQKDLLKFLIVRSLAVPISFTIGLILSFISPFLAKFSPMLIFPALKIINYKYKSVVEKYKRK
jgi:uncharacterized membrane protein